MEQRHLDAKGKGEYDYDYQNDILFFKIKNRIYEKSVEMDDVVVDVDKEGYITGIQIFGASKLLRINRFALKNVKEFELNTKIENKVITVDLRFAVVMRNKVLVQHGQNLMRSTTQDLRDSMASCKVAATA
jgi:uncharacterized protein YuzE